MISSQKHEGAVPFSNWQLFIGRFSFSLTTPLSIPECNHRFQHHLSFSYEASWGIAFGLAFSTKHRYFNKNDTSFCVELSSVLIPIIGIKAMGHFLSIDRKNHDTFYGQKSVWNLCRYIDTSHFLLTSAVFLLLENLEAIFLFLGLSIYFTFAVVNYMNQQWRFSSSFI